jgi:hypothetical protein
MKQAIRHGMTALQPYGLFHEYSRFIEIPGESAQITGLGKP